MVRVSSDNTLDDWERGSGRMIYSMSSDASEFESSSSFSCRGTGESPAPHIGSYVFGTSVMLPLAGGKDVRVWDESTKKVDSTLTEVEMMKERLAKLLLGEDMSGGGRGVCAALAISNAITNLSAMVFGNLWRPEPLDEQKKAVWRREMEWLLCVSDSIVEFVPSIQQLPCGGTCEVLITQPRSDLHANLPALKKLDALLLGILDGFREAEFSYVDPGCRSVREEDKWWLPCPRVLENGLSDGERKRLQDCRDCTEQILKAAMAINSSVLAEMEIPSAYFDALPKSERAHLGDLIHRCITALEFMPECLIEYLSLSAEHQTLEVVNRVEAAVHLWRRKDLKKLTSTQKFSLSGKVKSLVTDGDMNQLLATG